MSSLLLYIIVFSLLIFPLHQSFGIENLSQTQSSEGFDKILAKYWSWWINSPEDVPEVNPTCSMSSDPETSYVFFLNPFEIGDVSYDCTKQPIPSGHSIMFPLLTAFCSQGDAGLYAKSYQEIRDCTLNLDRGKIKGIVSLDDKVIVNISKDNGNGIEMKGVLVNNLPHNKFYKEIFSKEFVDLLATSNTTIPTNWEKPEEFEKSPIYYKAVVHCECIIINTSEFLSGNHELKYSVDAIGGKSTVDLEDTGWKFTSSATYMYAVE